MNEAKVDKNTKLTEAIQRMKALNINTDAIHAFMKDGVIPISFDTVENVYGLKPGLSDRINAFEDKHNALVYFVIFTPTFLGDMESYLFVSDFREEWDMDNEDLRDGYVMTWTENLTYPQCSEFGSISIQKTKFGGLRRMG